MKTTKEIKRETHTIDAKSRILGRLAVEIAVLLRGKGKPGFLYNQDMGDFVVLKNAKEIRVSGKKFKDKVYYRHTGYLGGLKETPYHKAFEKDHRKVIRDAVYGMMPKNKLRARQIKRLKID